MEKIFPSEIIDQSVERVIADIGRPGVNIYRTVLLLVCLSIFSLFFIRVDIVRTSQGIIRSSTDNIGLSTVTDGRVVLSALQENRTVVAGDTLLIQDTYLPDSRIKTTEGRISDTEDRLDDLSAMISGEKPLKTVRYSEDWNNFTSSAEKYRRETEYSEREYQTALGLYRSGVIPRVEFEKALYLYNQAKAAEEEYRSGILSRWKQLYFEAGRELEQYRLDSHSLLQERKNYYLISPASGSLINCTGIKTGQFLHAGQNLAELSLKETMVAECYVAPKDIAYLRQGMKAVIHIDAYNYR
ncbi:MAG: HlyD family secretion protein, partial [Bacteroidota bacterium]